jgi:BON domain
MASNPGRGIRMQRRSWPPRGGLLGAAALALAMSGDLGAGDLVRAAPLNARVALNESRPAPDLPAVTPQRELPGPEATSDAAISSRVKASLAADPAMAGADVSVNTDRGIVDLAGKVKSQEQAAIAAAHAQRPDGVMRVETHLSVDAR